MTGAEIGRSDHGSEGALRVAASHLGQRGGLEGVGRYVNRVVQPYVGVTPEAAVSALLNSSDKSRAS